MIRLLRLFLVVGALVGSGTWTTPAVPIAPLLTAPAAAVTPAFNPLRGQVDRLSRRHRCSTTGLPSGVVATRAILLERSRPGSRRVRIVPFARGWAAHTGSATGTLVAVCAG